MNAVDTNVLVYFVDEGEPEKQAKATELLERLGKEETETALLWQAAVEFLSCLRRWENEGRIDRATTLAHSSSDTRPALASEPPSIEEVFAILGRRHAHESPKLSDEVTAVVEADFQSDVGYAFLAVA